ncbi:MAG: ferredoxin [Oscillospiraceae bacterium]|nr:ferredoxin [Oscillospiraceae bacterium]
MKKLAVSTACISCGLCTVTNEYLQEDSTGQAIPVPGKLISDNELATVKQLIDNCPVSAISFVEVQKPMSAKDFIAAATKKISAIATLPTPKQSDFPYNSSEFSVPYYGAAGQYRYEYSSESSANSAAEREFNEKAYSQLKPFALKLVMQYKSKYLAPYYVSGPTSIYEKKNAEIKSLLAEIAGEYESIFGQKLPASFVTFEVFPDTERNSMLDMLRKDTVFSDEIADLIASKHRSEYPISNYRSTWDTDYEDKYIGKGMFGDKYKTVYCYKNVEAANKELADDMLRVAGWADINEIALDKACVVVDQYNRNMKKAIEEKIAILKNL